MIRPLRHVRTAALVLGLGLLAGAVRGVDAPAPLEKPAGDRPFVHTGLGSATDAAARDGALVLAVFESEACPACKSLDKVLASADFTDKAGLLHLLYFDVDGAPKTATAFKVRAVPDLVLMTAEMKIVARVQGTMSADELVRWIDRGRRRVVHGTWEGTALDADAGDLLAAGSDSEGLKRLVQALGDADPEKAELASRALEAQRERAVASLIDGLQDPYLGVRIGSSELLRRLAPAAPKTDPWDTLEARRARAAQVLEWWRDAGELLPAEPAADLSPEDVRSAQDALDGVLSRDPLRRTRGMTTLMRLGAPVLPRVREAIRKCTDAGDARTLALLEDVRWAILVPDRLEMRAGVRRSLARGTSEERQAAAARLGLEASAAFPALRELIDDPDTLVRESAVHALTRVGGPDSLAAIAELLKVKDANLRMVAAQALSSSKNVKAAPYLVTALDDPDEVVACVAIAGLEEVQAKDQGKALTSCLADKRWRVRAAAAEVIGKLGLDDANPQLLKLLEESDPFVTKSALTALRSTEAAPSAGTVIALIKREPSLTSLAVECVVARDSTAALRTVETVWDESDVERRGDILDGLTKSSSYRGSSSDSHWEALLTKASRSTDPLTRRKLVDLLAQRSVVTSSPFVTGLLEDGDVEVRVASARVVLHSAAYHWGVSGDTSSPEYGVLGVLDPRPREEAPGERSSASGDKPAGKRALEIQEMYGHWHELLGTLLDTRQDTAAALAFYVTGDGKTDLPVLARALEREDFAEDLKKLPYATMRVVGRRLAWPESKDLLERACRSPFLYARLAEALGYAEERVRTFVSEPGRIVAAVETSKGDDFKRVADVLLKTPGTEGGMMSLHWATESNRETLKRLVGSKVPAARALGVFAIGTRPRPPTDEELAVVEKALKDENPWVRRAAVQATMVQVPDQQEREKRLAPLLSDKNPAVAMLAAVGILGERLRNVSEISDYVYFRFEDARVWPSRYGTEREGPLPTVIERKPDFLDVVRERLARPPSEPSDDEGRNSMSFAFTLLLAQYGDFSGIEKELAEWEHAKEAGASPLLFIGLAMTRDARYLEPVRLAIENARNQYELRSTLRWLEGVPGREARELRRAVNRRMETAREY